MMTVYPEVQIGKIDTVSLDPNLYDDMAGYDDETGIQFANGLSADDRKLATVIYRYFNGLWGVIVVKGDPGQGKDVFGNYLSHRIKTFFPQKGIMRDEKPRMLYGKYKGLFNDEVLVNDLASMALLASGKGIKEIGAVLEKEAEKWVSEVGEVMLKNTVLYLTEFWRYCYNREPHNPMNKTMGAIHKGKRHLDCLVLGTIQLPSELDKKTCLPFVDWKVTSTRIAGNPTGFAYYIEKVKYDRTVSRRDPHADPLIPLTKRPYRMEIDAGKPRADLGNGKIILRKPDYRPETEEERVVLAVLKSGVDTYSGLVKILENDGDMEEWETLATLKELKFRIRKRVVDYPCWFAIYNSKSALQLKTSLKVED